MKTLYKYGPKPIPEPLLIACLARPFACIDISSILEHLGRISLSLLTLENLALLLKSRASLDQIEGVLLCIVNDKTIQSAPEIQRYFESLTRPPYLHRLLPKLVDALTIFDLKLFNEKHLASIFDSPDKTEGLLAIITQISPKKRDADSLDALLGRLLTYDGARLLAYGKILGFRFDRGFQKSSLKTIQAFLDHCADPVHLLQTISYFQLNFSMGLSKPNLDAMISYSSFAQDMTNLLLFIDYAWPDFLTEEMMTFLWDKREQSAKKLVLFRLIHQLNPALMDRFTIKISFDNELLVSRLIQLLSLMKRLPEPYLKPNQFKILLDDAKITEQIYRVINYFYSEGSNRLNTKLCGQIIECRKLAPQVLAIADKCSAGEPFTLSQAQLSACCTPGLISTYCYIQEKAPEFWSSERLALLLSKTMEGDIAPLPGALIMLYQHRYRAWKDENLQLLLIHAHHASKVCIGLCDLNIYVGLRVEGVKLINQFPQYADVLSRALVKLHKFSPHNWESYIKYLKEQPQSASSLASFMQHLHEVSPLLLSNETLSYFSRVSEIAALTRFLTFLSSFEVIQTDESLLEQLKRLSPQHYVKLADTVSLFASSPALLGRDTVFKLLKPTCHLEALTDALSTLAFNKQLRPEHIDLLLLEDGAHAAELAEAISGLNALDPKLLNPSTYEKMAQAPAKATLLVAQFNGQRAITASRLGHFEPRPPKEQTESPRVMRPRR